MQPTLPQATGAADMDLPAVQSMDWLFKKERIYLLAQFWQQRATLAEKEVNTLKEQLSGTNIISPTPTTTTSLSSPTAAVTSSVTPTPTSTTNQTSSAVSNKLPTNLYNNNNSNSKSNTNLSLPQNLQQHNQQHNGLPTPSPPLSDSGNPPINCIGSSGVNLNNLNNCSKLLLNNKMEDASNMIAMTAMTADMKLGEQMHPNEQKLLNNNNSSSNVNNNRSHTPNDKDVDCASNNNNNNSTSNNNSSSKNLADELAAKDREIKALIEEVTRLQALQESHIVQIQRLEERLEAKRQHILRLEARLEKQTDLQDAKKENNNLRSLDMTSPAVAAAAAAAVAASETKQFQELLFERTKALAAAQTEVLKSNSSSDDIMPNATLNNSHQDVDKASSHHETSSTASTPNLQDGRSTDEHMNGTGVGGMTPMSLSMIKTEDNNNTLGPLPHVPTAFLPGLPFQFQDRGHFRFSEDLQMPPGSMAGRLGESLIPKGDPMEAKLQEMLRYNMDKYANQNLDTLNISRRVRELLSVHNIGQRLFAKYILGLSQGTVSELLSKPKPWDKLTEKGRDSYRKMHAWGCDDNAVLLLKSLIPKKDSGMPQYGRSEDPMNEDRIAHILSEASNLMKTPQSQNIHHHQQQQQQQHQQQQLQQSVQQQSHQHHSSGAGQEDTHSNEDSKSPHNQCPSPFYKEALQRRLKPDDMSQDKVARIYQEELAKLMSRTPRDAFPSGGMPPAFAATANQMPDDNMRMALEAYHRELAKLQQTGGAIPSFPNLPGLLALQQQALNGAQDLSVKKEKAMKINGQQHNSSSCADINDQNAKDASNASEEALRHSSAFSLVRPKQEPGTPMNSNASTSSTTTASPLGNSILPPAMTPNEDFSAAASPLQRMASITNSLITQPPVTPHHSTPQRPMKAVLPPITQQQFDMFNNLNTEDIVRRVKEALSQYSISQRLFGESVLGLSQGSVSDLLARPKPWHMLTQKGREPFIRMKMFLEDENAVHKLVASQYKIAPEKLMRTGNYSGSPQIPTSLSNKMVPMQKMMNDLKMEPQHLMQMQAAVALNHIPTSQHQQGMLLTPPGLPPHHAINLPSNDNKKPMLMPMHSPQQNNAMRNMHQHMSPTVYEMAALTHDLDTQVITTKIKEALLANNIGQKIFGEAVLGLSQGSVSELLSKPKPWHMLSIKGREPFIRMQLWLSDANNVERLQALKNERREASKRRRSTGPGTQDNSSDTSSNDTADFYTNSPGPGSVGSTGVPPNKKQRVLFSEEQKEALRLAFALDPYPNVATIEFLASELGLATRTITNWFHNHRMRLKQQVPHGTPNEPVPSRENQAGSPFDPVQFRILLNQRLMELQKERMGLSGVPLPYPPYFAANPNLAALIGRGLLPTGEPDLATLNNAFKEQMSGLDLSMSSLKREREEFDDVDGEGDSHVSDTESIDGSEVKTELKETPTSIRSGSLQSRISRRKPAAPQWVNPDWQDNRGSGAPGGPISGAGSTDQEVIINGVCVMQQQAADYSRKSGAEETVRIEPAAVQDRFNDVGEDDATSDNEDEDVQAETESQMSNKQSDCGETNENNDNETEAGAKPEGCESPDQRSTHDLSESKDDNDDTAGVWNY